MQNAIDERWTRHAKFWEGHEDEKALRRAKDYQNVDGQAYDRGYEVGMHEPKRKYEHWGDDPTIGERVGLN
jgi:hypothetical protein